MPTIEDYKGQIPAWCPGCGDFGILNSLKRALVELNLAPRDVLIVSGIGQAAKLPHYMRVNTFNGLHGRALSPATGAKISNGKLVVIAIGGDGDGYGEGGNHFMHTIRRNPDITLFVHNNQVYGLTKGQASPTSDIGMVTKVQHEGVMIPPFNPLAVAVALDASFVGRSFTGEPDHLVSIMKEAITNKGFSIVDILQPCVSFNKKNTFAWYKQRVKKIESGYDPTNREEAFKKSLIWPARPARLRSGGPNGHSGGGDEIPIGVIYKHSRPTFDEQVPALKKGVLIDQKLNPRAVEPLLKEFM